MPFIKIRSRALLVLIKMHLFVCAYHILWKLLFAGAILDEISMLFPDRVTRSENPMHVTITI